MNMNKKFKHIKHSANLTEDSSDYISSDVEGPSSKKFELDPTGSLSNGSTNFDAPTNIHQINEEYSNDSFLYDRDNENSSSFSAADRRQKSGTISGQQTHSLDEARLAECLTYLHKMISRKDKEDIFQFPVTDLIAPGYSQIIKNPMDLSTMKLKIDSFAYSNIMEYRDDLILMCENCMTYNKPDTIYYHAARKMLDYGFKLLSKEKILALRHTVRIMRMLTSNELGFSIDGGNSTDLYYDTNKLNQAQRAIKSQQAKQTILPRINLNQSNLLAKSMILQKLDALQPKESYLVPPEGEDVDEENDENYQNDITEEVQELARTASERLMAKNKNGKMGFLRRNSNGTTGYHFLKRSGPSNLSTESLEEKPLTIGNLCEGLQVSSYSMNNFLEEKKNKAKPMYYLENGPFSSHAPVYDSSYGNISKEESDILLTSYGDETGYQYALSLMEFSKATNNVFNKYVNTVLNNLSCNEHEKYLKYLNSKQQTSAPTQPPGSN